MSQGMFLAKALYDNMAETPDELAFRRGDVLTVLEQDTAGLEGWWLCSLRGKHGIAPGNRLKILSGMGPRQDSRGNTSLGDLSGLDAVDGKPGMELYDHPNRSFQDYDVPPSHRSSLDVVSPARRPSHDSLRSSGSQGGSMADLYDTPPSSKRGSTDNGIYDTPPSSKRASSERSPPRSNRSSASRDSGSNLLSAGSKSSSQLSLQQKQNSLSSLNLPNVARRRSGSQVSDNCYETPPGSNRSSLERILCEEGTPIYDTLSPAGSSERLDTGEALYDTPPVRPHALSHASPASQSSLRSLGSSESLLSNTSGVSSTQLSQAASLPDSARSSMDIPSETYDVPPALQEGNNSRKQLSMDSGLGFYDSPTKSRPASSSTTHSADGLKNSQSSFDCKSTPSSNKDIKRSKSMEHALDDVYDTPPNNAPKISMKKSLTSMTSTDSGRFSGSTTSGVYDIPPQVTRDSVISNRSDSSDENQRFSSSSADLDQQLADVSIWTELMLDVDSAMEVLVKRQQDINKATARLAGFVNETWRTRTSLEKTLYDIKVSCSLVKNSLHDLVKFAQGAMANASKLPDRSLSLKLNKLVAPLRSTDEFVTRSFNNLEEMKWQVSQLSEPLDKTKLDDLGQIALVARDLMPEVKKVTSFIQANSASIFRKATSEVKKPAVASKPPIGPKLSEPNGGKKGMLHRPLPAVPGAEKPTTPASPATPPTVVVASVTGQQKKLSMYDIKAALHQDDYAECDELPKGKADLAQKEILEQVAQEYDYVQLDARDDVSPKAKDETDSKTDESQFDEVDSPKEGEKLSKDKEVDEVEKSLKNVSVVDEEMDMIPVRDGGANASSSEAASKLEVSSDTESNSGTLTRQSAQEAAELLAGEPESPDMPTPVNTANSNSEGSSFILPEASIETKTDLDPNDRQVLVYYTDQVNTHYTLLSNAIDAFIGVVGSNQPPNVFISHSKFVIVSAHKLVHIGDSIHRNLNSNNVSAQIMHTANQLCDCLKASVNATKVAALQYPSAPAVQEMVNRVIAVSQSARELKLVITQSAR